MKNLNYKIKKINNVLNIHENALNVLLNFGIKGAKQLNRNTRMIYMLTGVLCGVLVNEAKLNKKLLQIEKNVGNLALLELSNFNELRKKDNNKDEVMDEEYKKNEGE